MKHSPPVASVAFGTPCVAEVKSPRQQYRPADVIVAAADVSGCDVPWLIDCESTRVPPLVQVAVDVVSVPMKHRWKSYVPLHVDTPVTVTVALSVTLTIPDCGICVEPLIDGVVVVLELHSPSWPRA